MSEPKKLEQIAQEAADKYHDPRGTRPLYNIILAALAKQKREMEQAHTTQLATLTREKADLAALLESAQREIKTIKQTL